MTTGYDHQETLFETHAKRYLRDANGDKRRARRNLLHDRAANPHAGNFYTATLKALDAIEAME